MGIDPSLTDDHPSIIINGRKFHYGREPHYGQYLVENANYAKDYWVFNAKEDLEAFLINLPESADNLGRIRKSYPDWHEVTAEQRDAYFAEDLASQRSLADEKRRTGTAPSYNMDLEGKHGPHEPQQIHTAVKLSPIERVNAQLQAHKQKGFLGFNDALKLRVLEGEIEWSGVDARDKETILAREVNFAAITKEQFAFVFQDIRFETRKPADDTVARGLFEQAREQTGETRIRDTTRNLVQSVMLDNWPRSAAIIDFGLKSQQHYEALYYPIREGEITPQQLDAALGNGDELTGLARAAPSNPHRGITFHTDWDEILRRPADGDAARAKPRMPSPGEIASSDNRVETDRAPHHENDRGRKR
jgi:hypothetical protein